MKFFLALNPITFSSNFESFKLHKVTSFHQSILMEIMIKNIKYGN